MHVQCRGVFPRWLQSTGWACRSEPRPVEKDSVLENSELEIEGKCKMLIVTFEQSRLEALPTGKSALGRKNSESNSPDVDAHSVHWHYF